MGLDALTRNTAGLEVVPASPEEWDDWVSASATRNYILKDPLVDWLERYGEAHGFVRDTSLPDRDERLEFGPFIMRQGIAFEAAVAEHLASLAEMVRVSAGHDDVRDLAAAERTFEALAGGAPIVHQGVLRDAESRTYGAPDFLVRADVFAALFPGALSAEEANAAAPGLGLGLWHYVVVDAKFTTLHLLTGGEVNNGSSAPAYKAQLYVYNRALGRLQGHTPARAFLLGRGWEQRGSRGTNAMERAGPVSMGDDLRAQVEAAAAWLRRMRAEGERWSPLPRPTVPELRPNGADWPWADAVKRIMEELGDLILLWQVGVERRNAAVRAGISDWRDPRRPEPALEFFVDFEYVSNLADDFSAFPEQGGRQIIFMIGCGHVENGEWVFRCFTADRLDEPAEARAIDAWLAHMEEARSRLGAEDAPRLFHWAPAEEINYEKAYNSARKRHPAKGWPVLEWFDLLRRVVSKEPVVVRGALGFGLKAVARAFHEHGLIETSWGSSKVDGMGAMTGAWWCDREAAGRGVRLADLDLMQEIAAYNEVDCKVMMEVLRHLRAHH